MPENIIQSQLLAKIAGLEHGFTTRKTSAEANSELEKKVSTAKQVHGQTILWPDSYERRTREADGIGTFRPNFYVGAYSADCTPVLLVLQHQGTTKAVMAIHAGWRGTALQIVEKAVPELLKKSKISPQKAKLYAAIGPCISREKFEVAEDVIQAFPHALSQGLAQPFRIEAGKQKYQFDLAGENLRQLRTSASTAGLDLEVDTLGLCTVSDPASFPSFRRDRESLGRILSYIAFATDHTSVP